MATLRQQILDALLETLSGADKPAGLTVLKARKRPSVPGELPVMMIVCGKESVTRASNSVKSPIVSRVLRIGLDVWVVDPESQDALEPFVAWGTAAIMDSGLLGGAARDITEDEIVWDFDMLENSFGRTTQWFTVYYVTTTISQEAKS